MRQLILRGDCGDTHEADLDPVQSRYLIRVLRMRKGDSFPAVDDTGCAVICSIEDADPRRVKIRIEREAATDTKEKIDGGETKPSLGWPEIVLVQALPKGPKMDIIIRQSVEMGVSLIVPLKTRFCVQKERAEGSSTSKALRRAAIITEARQQSGSDVKTRMTTAVGLSDLPGLLYSEGFGLDVSSWILFHETDSSGRSLHEILSGRKTKIVACVGAEGGFAADETASLRTAGFYVYHFSGPIMRTETAALAAISATKTIFLERTLWNISI
jgi:16S rRNA (uracil1498-N3)-methyltransferase